MDDALKRLVELDSRIWRLGLTQGQVDSWLDQFDGECEDASDERGLALYLLANLMFFGLAEIRILCASLFRDHYLRRATTEYRIAHGDTVDLGQIGAHVDNELQSTRFVGLGTQPRAGRISSTTSGQATSLSSRSSVRQPTCCMARTQTPPPCDASCWSMTCAVRAVRRSRWEILWSPKYVPTFRTRVFLNLASTT